VKHLIKKGIAKKDGKIISLHEGQICIFFHIIIKNIAFLDEIVKAFNIESS
jgi:hypothetical protein